MGMVNAIWVKTAHRGPMNAVKTARLVRSKGIMGNADYGAKRHVTLVEAEIFDKLSHEFGKIVDPVVRRANVLLSGVELRESTGKVLLLGDTSLRILGETDPCHRMDEAIPGLQEALRRDWFGGAWGIVLEDGMVKVGDGAEWS